MTGDGLGRNADIGATFAKHPHDFGGACLLQAEMDVRKRFAKIHHRLGQRVARACVWVVAIVSWPVSAFASSSATCLMFAESIRMRSTRPTISRPGSVSPSRRLPRRDEKLDAEFALEVLDMLADAGLRCRQRLRHVRQIEVAANRFADDPKLLEIHWMS